MNCRRDGSWDEGAKLGVFSFRIAKRGEDTKKLNVFTFQLLAHGRAAYVYLCCGCLNHPYPHHSSVMTRGAHLDVGEMLVLTYELGFTLLYLRESGHTV